MARIQTHLFRWRLPIALAIVALLAAAIFPAFAEGDPPPEPLLPNVEPAGLSADAAETPPIWTLAEREAVEATLAAYFASGQLTPPDGATYSLDELKAMGDGELAALAARRVYLPLVRRSAELGQITPTPVTPTPVTPTPRPGTPADVVVTVWPKPSIWVGRGAILEYEIRLKNTGKGDATETRVVFPFNANQVTPAYTSLDSKAGDWVADATASRFTVVFGRLAEGKSRTGKIFVRVAANPNPVPVIDVRASYTWRDGVDGGGQRSNWTPVLIGGGPSDAPYIWVRVTPDRGGAGTQHSFYTDRFLPGEGVSAWLNTPWGVQALNLRGTADGNGAVTLAYRTSGLPRGNYQMVLYGQRSGLTGVAGFTVQ